MYFAASREEMVKAGESIDEKTLEVTGGGYLATLGVYHELHCIVSKHIDPGRYNNSQSNPL
jgi:hypothetical protein